MRSVTARRGGVAALAAALVAGVVLVPGTAAFADDTVALTPSTQTVEYGQGWYVQGQLSPDYFSDSQYGTPVVTTGSASKDLGAVIYHGLFGFSDFDLGIAGGLGAGTHSLTVTFNNAQVPITPPAPVSVTVTPTKVLATTTITADPNNPRNAIVTSQLSGPYIDQLPNCGCEAQNGYVMPVGSWNLSITDSSGKSVLTKTASEAANGLPTFVSYWQNVPAGETFSALSTFTVSGSAAANFTLSSQKFSWTSSKAGDTGGAIIPTHSAAPAPIKTASFAPPLGVFVTLLALALVIAALDIVLLVRRRRGPAHPNNQEHRVA
jgi:hypothetical protein